MTNMVQELRGVIARQIETAADDDVLSVVNLLCTGQQPLTRQAPAIVAHPARRFVKLDEDGIAIPDDSSDWRAVEDTTHGLIWDRRPSAKKYKWKDRQKGVPSKLCGWTDWRVPTVRELLALVDYERREPAIDTGYFDCGDDWYWTDTPLHGSPSDYAWLVPFHHGNSGWGRQDNEGLVRAVRRSQSFGLLARAA